MHDLFAKCRYIFLSVQARQSGYTEMLVNKIVPEKEEPSQEQEGLSSLGSQYTGGESALGDGLALSGELTGQSLFRLS